MKSLQIAVTAMLIGALALTPACAVSLFQDDFEAGFGNWTQVTPASPLTWSTERNAVPAGSGHSAKSTLSLSRMYHNLGFDTSLGFVASWWIYDSSMTRAYAEVQSHATDGYGTTPDQIYAAGKYNNISMPGEVWDGTKYQGRIVYPSETMGWFNLNDPGSPNRSPGWHRFDVHSLGNGTVRFYVDGILSRTITSAVAKPVDCVVLGFGTNSSSNGDTYFDGVSVSNANVLALNAQGLNVPMNTLYVKYGQLVNIKMDVSGLAQKVNGCQAMLGYSNYYLFAESGCVAPGGGAWDQLIYNSWDVGAGIPGEIDTAIGVNAQGSIGTDADGTIASIQFVARDKEGTTKVEFRPDVSDVESTFLSNMVGGAVYPFKASSQNIVIDGTPPALNILSARQGASELLASLGSTTAAVQGRVDFAVTASDAHGLPAAPAVNVYDANLVAIPCTFDSQSPVGQYNYHVTIPATAANGVATVRAAVFDRAGYRTDQQDNFLIQKNQITGTVTLQGFVGASRSVDFSIDGGPVISKVLAFTGGTASYTLTNVPDGVTAVSAKTNWNLRKKQSCALDGNGQAVVNFTGASQLLAGDVNGSNTINILDYTTVKVNWYSTNPIADIDGNGAVNKLDYDLMIGNWYKFGDVL